MKIRAVAFDIDGTLYPNYLMFLLTFPSFLKHPLLVYHFSKIRKEIRNTEYNVDFRTKQAELLAASMKIRPEQAGEKLQKQLYDSWDRAFRKLRPYRHVRSFLETLKRKGFRTAVLSDFPIGNKLQYLGLDIAWDAVISSETTGYLKPSRVPFDYVAQKLGTANKEILYVGNSYKYDIIGARAAGMRTAYLGRNGSGKEADFIFSDYKDLEKQLFFASEAG
ncbi:MAG: HAD family hydrolase [Spirochaetales bacterium]|nr:HAD family hydrolase [Spirochaetales bacterium]